MEKKVEKQSLLVWLIEDARKALWKAMILLFIYGVFKGGDILLLTSPGLISVYKCYIGYSIIRLIFNVIKTFLTYKNTRYYYNQEEFYLKKGGFTISESYIPLKHIQHLDVTQSFFSRLFNVAEVQFYTAGNNHKLQYLQKKDAMEIKNYVIDCTKTMSLTTTEEDKGEMVYERYH